jgi:hypothetical protein
MSAKALSAFFEEQIADARDKDLMVSLHLKVRIATTQCLSGIRLSRLAAIRTRLFLGFLWRVMMLPLSDGGGAGGCVVGGAAAAGTQATMMKVSDPIMFGHCVKAFYKDALAVHAADLDAVVNAHALPPARPPPARPPRPIPINLSGATLCRPGSGALSVVTSPAGTHRMRLCDRASIPTTESAMPTPRSRATPARPPCTTRCAPARKLGGS